MRRIFDRQSRLPLFAKRGSIIICTSILVSALQGAALRSGLELYPTDLGTAHAGQAALAEDASTAASNPAGMKLAYDSSPIAMIGRWKSPVLVIHGDDDRAVPFQQTTDLVQHLKQQRVDFEELIIPDEGHDFLLWRSWVHAYEATADFFNRKLSQAQ